MIRFLLLTSLAALVLAEPDIEPIHLKDSSQRVVGGEVAKPNSWRWQISLQIKVGNNYKHDCGGTLIKKGWVMTAAHCVDRAATRRVVLGEHDLSKISGREQFIGVSRVYIHPSWIPGNFGAGYDIALLRLSSEAKLNSYVQLGSLPPSGKTLPYNKFCFITGWGRTSIRSPLSEQLKQAYLPLVDYSICTRSDWWGGLLKSTALVCAGGGANSGCKGDSGGPLNCYFRGKYYIHGVTSFGSEYECNYPKKPTVFTRVSSYIKWMNSIMA